MTGRGLGGCGGGRRDEASDLGSPGARDGGGLGLAWRHRHRADVGSPGGRRRARRRGAAFPGAPVSTAGRELELGALQARAQDLERELAVVRERLQVLDGGVATTPPAER